MGWPEWELTPYITRVMGRVSFTASVGVRVGVSVRDRVPTFY